MCSIWQITYFEILVHTCILCNKALSPSWCDGTYFGSGKEYNLNFLVLKSWGGGYTDLERVYGDVRPSRPPFHTLPAAP